MVWRCDITWMILCYIDGKEVVCIIGVGECIDSERGASDRSLLGNDFRTFSWQKPKRKAWKATFRMPVFVVSNRLHKGITLA